MNKSGKGVINFNVQAGWLNDYERNQLEWVQTAHPGKSEEVYKGYQAGIRAGWNKLRATLVAQGIVTTDWKS